MMLHGDQVIALLRTQIANDQEVADIKKTAEEVATKWVDPLAGGRTETNGLIYGLVQSGKTGVLSVTGAIGADEGYKTIVVLTSDIDPLYEQTLNRIREAFPGIDILSKADIKQPTVMAARLRQNTCAIVITKNASMLKSLCENIKAARLRAPPCLIIDDEADQASLNTRESRGDGSRSTINARISELRSLCGSNTYL